MHYFIMMFAIIVCRPGITVGFSSKKAKDAISADRSGKEGWGEMKGWGDEGWGGHEHDRFREYGDHGDHEHWGHGDHHEHGDHEEREHWEHEREHEREHHHHHD
jgi:hypothetical protein